MTDAERLPLREQNRRMVRDLVLDAAERLLRQDATADFSMRALAAEAGVGFATPFNHFGSKNAIMQALSERVIARMRTRFEEEGPEGDAIDRVTAMGRIAVALLLEQPAVYKAVVGSLGVVSQLPSAVRLRSTDLWTLALGDLKGLAGETAERARLVLAEQLAFSFRGCLSFWIAGELDDKQLEPAFVAAAATLLLGFAEPSRRAHLLALLAKNGR
ncbi:TetR/AcrR family transcriptional regulator [Ancylobacter sonchi]|uniref:TetR/AcrR family transcriptional regulator n=1 Tax=Ancylobacter sonchi TaxID=1937790 RepID=UPI001BD4781F|nr:TetR/AcrR family transcriptional regulator [Ancylobacter sonchi]MBS7535548.1 TetR/AcrR family transcriptional regulator [Ancylobacter sonchi]